MVKKLLLVLLLALPVCGQDIPKPRDLTSTDYFVEIAQLHMQVKQLTEYINSLQMMIRSLQDENAKLKNAAKDTP